METESAAVCWRITAFFLILEKQVIIEAKYK